jgi:diaminohydroxyphosphoribosylaminopyrimidine deaminase / 5-amino-6-(5-phosphoribosylamino)uracil reductase
VTSESEPPEAVPPGAVSHEGGADEDPLRAAIALARRSPPSATAYSVGCVILDAHGALIAESYSRRDDPHDHAEEGALASVAPGDPRLSGATLYSSLEPCAARASRARSCAERIIAAGIPRVVFAWSEPPLFVAGGGAEKLRAAGVEVVQLAHLAEEARAANAHLPTE